MIDPCKTTEGFDESLHIGYNLNQIIEETKRRLSEIKIIEGNDITIPITIANVLFPDCMNIKVKLIRKGISSDWILDEITTSMKFINEI